MLVAALQTLVVPTVGDIARRLQSSPSAISWVITANLLAAAVFTPLLGRLGDVRNRRRVLLGILIAVVVGSALAATTSLLPLLILGRILQGSAYAVFPLAIGILRDELKPAQLTNAVAIVSGSLALGGGLGLVAAGALTQHHGDYHRIFWLSLVLSVMALALAASVVPDRAPPVSGSIDWLGAGILGVALVLLLLPLSQGNEWGWGSPATVGCFVGFLVTFAVWLAVERRVAAPLVSLGMLTNRPILITNLSGLLVGVTMFISFLAVSYFVETPPELAGYGFGASVLASSTVYLLPGALGGVITAPLGGQLVRRYGGRATLIIGGVLGLAGFALMAIAHTQSWQIVVGTCASLTGVNFGYAALPALLIAEVSPDDTGIANGVNSICRSVGSSLGSALTLALLTNDMLPGVGLPRESAYVNAFMIGAAGFALLVLLATFGFPRGVHRTGALAEADGNVVLTAAGTSREGSPNMA